MSVRLSAGVGSTGTLCTPWLSVARQVGSKAGGLWGFFFWGRGLPRTDAAAVLGRRVHPERGKSGGINPFLSSPKTTCGHIHTALSSLQGTSSSSDLLI